MLCDKRQACGLTVSVEPETISVASQLRGYLGNRDPRGHRCYLRSLFFSQILFLFIKEEHLCHRRQPFKNTIIRMNYNCSHAQWARGGAGEGTMGSCTDVNQLVDVETTGCHPCFTSMLPLRCGSVYRRPA